MSDSFHSTSATNNEDFPRNMSLSSLSNRIKSPPMDCQSDQTSESGHDGEKDHRRNRRWTVFLFSLTTVLLFADQNLMSPNLTAIADEFYLDEEERDRKLGGDISLAFFLVGAPASFLVGLLADDYDRAKIFGWTVFIGEAACFFTYFVKNYGQLYACRAVTGFSVGGALPVIYSILGDLFKAEDRHIVSAIVSAGLGAGISIGQAVAGYMGPVFGWRLPFLVVSVPAMVCAFLVYFTVKDPERGAMEKIYLDENKTTGGSGVVALVPVTSRTSLVNNETYSDEDTRDGNDSQSEYSRNKRPRETSGKKLSWRHHLRTSMSLMSTKTVALSLIQGAPGCIPWGIINVFLNDYLSEDRGFSVQAATTVLMLFSIGYGAGLFVGGAGGKMLYKIDVRLPALLAGGTAIVGCFPFWYLINGVDVYTPFPIVAASAMMTGLGSAPTGPIIKATLTNVTLPRARGQAFALFNLFDDFGKGLGPFFVSLLIVRFGRTLAFNIGVLGWIVCGIANLAIFFTVAHDEHEVQTMLAAELSDGL